MHQESDLVRIARIGDSVFAVTLTLLAYRVRIPSEAALLGGKLGPLLPFLSDLGAVVLSFFVASMFWLSRLRVFRRMQKSDITFVGLNLAFYGAMILLPISTSLLSADVSALGRVVYSGNLFLASTFNLFLRRHARRIDPEAFGKGPLLLSPALSMLVFGSAAIVSLYSPTGAIVLWNCALLTPWIDTRRGMRAS